MLCGKMQRQELTLIGSNEKVDLGQEALVQEGFGPVALAEVLFSLSRRHALPFSVLALSARSGHAKNASEFGHLEQCIAGALRQTDVFTRWGKHGSWLVFCPSTTQEGAKELGQRVLSRADERALALGVASFREEALTLPDLIELAGSNLEATYGRRADASIGPAAGTWPLAPRRRTRFGAWLKRGFDVTAVLAAAPLWAPIVFLCAVAIWLSAPSAPVLFRQERTGRGGRRFEMLKFRTMVPHAEALKEELAHLNELQWPDFKVPDDPRITAVGKLLRKTSLDELPQLWNVLRGEMSLVGPRPTSFSPDDYEAWHTARLDVPPGITGLWQIEARASAEFDERLRLDLEYVRRQGFFYDLWILLRTLPIVLSMRGGH